MALQIAQRDDDPNAVIASINTTPLVDVMLVLLIIFLITIPVVNTAVPVTLPKERVEVRAAQPDVIIVSVDVRGQIYWFDTPLPNAAALQAKLRPVAGRQPQPEIHIRGDLAARYEGVGRVLAACQRVGLTRVSFITEPPPRP
ncbi:MAG: biopolymer transporter ExbD [Rhodoferax sp.]